MIRIEREAIRRGKITAEEMISWAEQGARVEIRQRTERGEGIIIQAREREKERTQGKMIVAQVRHYIEPEKRRKIAKMFEQEFHYHLIGVMKLYKEQEQSRQEALISETEKITFEKCNTLEEIRSREGWMVKKFYEFVRHRFKEYSFGKRTYHPPKDGINALLSYLNSMLYTEIEKIIVEKTTLSPYVGYIHTVDETIKKKPLVLDIGDIYKPLTVYHSLMHMMKYKIIKPEELHDIHREGRISLDAAVLTRARKIFYHTLYNKPILKTIRTKTVLDAIEKYVARLRVYLLTT